MNKWLFALIATALFISGQSLVIANEEFEDKYYGANLCSYPEFHCIHIKPSDTWTTLFPNERQREMVKRLNRTNTPVNYRSWIVVPNNMSQIDYMDLSPFPNTIKATGQKLVIVNLGLQAFGAYDENGNLVHWGPVSGGKGWCPDAHRYCYTAVGSFKVISKEGPECVSTKFPMETEGGAPMPYCMYYYRGFALHGSTLPGFNASHGCIRLFVEDAEWLNKHFLKEGDQVIVTR
jgi:lipoprotein-anchoring transpeptidase ErfK/SrfK